MKKKYTKNINGSKRLKAEIKKITNTNKKNKKVKKVINSEGKKRTSKCLKY